jgi:hypothetical protein
MKATIENQVQNAINYAHKKELTRALSVVALQGNGSPTEVVTARWYMGRSADASVILCSVWIHGGGIYTSGAGKAGGGGYDKYSAAFADAINSAGVVLNESIAGVGNTAIERACAAIVRVLGVGSPDNLLFVRH